MSDRTYTLAEAQRELALRECARHGHTWTIHQNIASGPLRISCDRCGWSGGVTMGPRPTSEVDWA